MLSFLLRTNFLLWRFTQERIELPFSLRGPIQTAAAETTSDVL
jgi:hypothetical protein